MTLRSPTSEKLAHYRSQVLRLFWGGIAVSAALVVVAFIFWPGIHTRLGIGVLGFISLALIFGPVSYYISRFRCPRCQSPWLLPSTHDTRQHGDFQLWAFAHWQSCRACSLSASRTTANNGA